MHTQLLGNAKRGKNTNRSPNNRNKNKDEHNREHITDAKLNVLDHESHQQEHKRIRNKSEKSPKLLHRMFHMRRDFCSSVISHRQRRKCRRNHTRNHNVEISYMQIMTYQICRKKRKMCQNYRKNKLYMRIIVHTFDNMRKHYTKSYSQKNPSHNHKDKLQKSRKRNTSWKNTRRYHLIHHQKERKTGTIIKQTLPFKQQGKPFGSTVFFEKSKYSNRIRRRNNSSKQQCHF